MRIGIVGLGMAGAPFAAALARRNIEAQVFEQAPEIREVGAGLGLWANATRMLGRIGLAQELERVGTPSGQPTLRTPRGDIVQNMHVQSKDGVSGYTVHRAELLEAMVARVPPSWIHLNKQCAGVTAAGDEVRLDFADGSSADFDLVVGADGIWSSVLGAFGSVAPARFANLFAYRGLAPNTPEIGLTEGRVWADGKSYVIVFPVSGGQKINLAAFVPCDAPPESNWSSKGEKASLKAEFAGWDPFLHKIIDALPETFRWGLYFRDPLPNIVAGRIALIGDAAHAMTPHAGMGAGQAVEDALALAALLDGCTAADVPERLRLYEQLRLPRAHMVQENTRRNAQFMHASFPLKPGEGRPRALAETADMIDYDSEKEAEALLARA